MFKPYLGTCLVAVLIMAGHAGAQTPLSQQPPAGVGASVIGSGTKGQLFLVLQPGLCVVLDTEVSSHDACKRGPPLGRSVG